MKKLPRPSSLPAALGLVLTLLFTAGLQNAGAVGISLTSDPSIRGASSVSQANSLEYPATDQGTDSAQLKTFLLENLGGNQRRSYELGIYSVDENGGLGELQDFPGTEFRIQSPGSENGFIEAGSGFQFGIRFNPTGRGQRSAFFKVKFLSQGNSPSSNRWFKLTGRGTEPIIEVKAPDNSVLSHDPVPSFTLPSQSVNSSSLPQTFTINNLGVDTLKITGISVGGDNSSEFQVNPPTLPLDLVKLDGTTTFAVIFTPTRGGIRNATITVTHRDAPRNPFTVELQATGLAGEIGVKDPDGATMTYSATAASFPNHNFPQTPANATSSRQFTIENSGNNPLNITSITSSSGDFIVSAVPQTVAPPEGGRNGSETFLVTFSPSSGGTKSGIITINSSDPEEGTFGISVTGTAVVPDIVVKNPAGTTLGADGSPTVTLPSTSVNTAGSPQTFRIENSSSGAPLSITGITSSSTEFEVANIPGSVNPSAFQEFSVTFRPSGGGPRTGTLTITSNDPDEGTFAVNLSATGLQPDFALKGPSGAALPAGATVSLPATAVNGTTTRTFTIANSGGTPLTISNIQSSNTAEFTVGGTALPVTIGTGNEQTFTVAFEPDSQGTRQADLLVTHDDPSKPSPFQISLTGLGTSSSIAVKDPDGQYIPYRPADDSEYYFVQQHRIQHPERPLQHPCRQRRKPGERHL